IPYLQAGAAALPQRGSGGARLVVGQAVLPDSLRDEIQRCSAHLVAPLVARSSSLLEGSGEWSGAFTSYLEVNHAELPKAVTGCWASVFTVATLERFTAAAIEPGSAAMAVLIQTALQPDFGGTARIDGDETAVIGVAGSPAPLVQGWDPGAHGKVTLTGEVLGAEAIALMGESIVAAVAATLRHARDTTGANTCEWAAVGEDIFLLQLLRTAEIRPGAAPVMPELTGALPMLIARLVRRYPGPMGESLILPWAVAAPEMSLEEVEPAGDIDPAEALQTAAEHADAMTAQVWGLPKAAARARAQETFRALRGSDPAAALAILQGLRPIDSERSHYVRRLVARARSGLVAAGAVGDLQAAWHVEPQRAAALLRFGETSGDHPRIGFDRWEPFDATVVISNGRAAHGTSAGPGIGAGRMCFITDQASMTAFRPRDVVVAARPLPSLAQLLWDAAAVVTMGGSPAAHLFESARALAIPAVCAVYLDEALEGNPAVLTGERALAVDGHGGSVYAMMW
ncbi:MAG TPA: PEP/pyruvate-binding domain-containing protein, partial [Acidimicrobiia bacterium]|nr:PEP/pyruvate-binding domain-containing protein [Acidimicrobiia bacterium]